VLRERSQAANEPAIRITTAAAGTVHPPTLADKEILSFCHDFFGWYDMSFSRHPLIETAASLIDQRRCRNLIPNVGER
jgi:hypothetical protein